MVLIRNEVVVSFLRHGMNPKGSGSGPLKAWRFFRKEVVVAQLSMALLVSKTSGRA